MPTTLPPQEIITEARCIDCGVPEGFQLSALIYLFGQIAGVSDIQTIITGAKCIDCAVPPGFRMSALIYLADQILANGGAGGGGGVTCGTSDPVDAPSGSCAIYYRRDTGAMWLWDGSSWVLKV